MRQDAQSSHFYFFCNINKSAQLILYSLILRGILLGEIIFEKWKKKCHRFFNFQYFTFKSNLKKACSQKCMFNFIRTFFLILLMLVPKNHHEQNFNLGLHSKSILFLIKNMKIKKKQIDRSRRMMKSLIFFISKNIFKL